MAKSQQNNGAYKVTKIGIILEIPPSGSSFNTYAEAMPRVRIARISREIK